MERLREQGILKDFSEKGVGCEVFLVGSIAVAIAGCEMIENRAEVTRDVSVFLLLKNPDGWRIAAQAWDLVDDILPAFAATGLGSQ